MHINYNHVHKCSTFKVLRIIYHLTVLQTLHLLKCLLNIQTAI